MNKQEKELARLELEGERAVLEEMRGHYAAALSRVYESIDALAERADPSGIRQRQFQESLAEQIGGILDDLDSGRYSTMEQYLEECYEQGFVGTLYNMQRQGIPLAFPIDQRSAANAVRTTANGVKLSSRIYADSDRLKRRVVGEITRGFADSSHVAQTASRIDADVAGSVKQNVKGVCAQSFRRSMTIARTEKGRVKATSTLDAMLKAKAEGADIVKQWDSTMDGRTRPDHARANGQIRELEEDFEVGGHKGPSPHLIGAASQDINCRCVCLQRARSALEMPEALDHTKWDGISQCFVDLSDAKSYGEFKGLYDELVGSLVPIRPKSSFIPAKSIEEAQTFAQRFVDADKFAPTFKNSVDYKGVSLEIANEINQALDDVFGAMDIPKIAGIKTISAKSAKGKKIFSSSDAVAAYNFSEQGIFLNKDILKSKGAFERYVDEAKEAFDFVKANLGRLSGSKRDVAERYVEAGRSLVDGCSVSGAITHEVGHHVDWAVISGRGNDIRRRSSQYSGRISGYAGSSNQEYMAESFVAYMRGERDILDPEYVRLLEEKAGAFAASQSIDGDTSFVRDEIASQLRKNAIRLQNKEFPVVVSAINTNFEARFKGKRYGTICVNAGDSAYEYHFIINEFDDYTFIERRKID